MPESRFKLFSDPVHGFISVPKGLVMELIQQPEVQRLRRIRQLGVGHLVFPGAEHTRFNHALGAMALMQEALASIEGKGTSVSAEERTAALAAALLHDIGHGPYSHTLEHYLIRDFRHEQMSRRLLVRLKDRLARHPEAGALALALRIFDGTYERAFFHRLVSSQLDMDRLDYLRRDAFYTGVAEGEVGVERLLKTLRVVTLRDGAPDAHVAVEAKGIYAVENFLISRRLMYWQVYLHKTVLAGDELLRAAFRRVRARFREGRTGLGEGCSPALCFFLKNDLTAEDLDRPAVIDHYAALDDTDVLFSFKQWQHAGERHGDPVLADLCRRFLDRDFFRVTFLQEKPSEEQMSHWRAQVARWLQAEGRAGGPASEGPSEEAAHYYLTLGHSRHSAYQRERGEAIGILDRDGQVRELSEMADTAALTALSERVTKPYLCYPKEVELNRVPAPAGA